MSLDPLPHRLLVAVGSRRDRVCSVGAFARAEARALEACFRAVEILEPDGGGSYPRWSAVTRPDVIFFHAPSLHDRRRPWNVLVSALTLRRAFPAALFIPIVHEFSEAPLHWKARQLAVVRAAHAVIVNSRPDHEGLKKWHRRVLRTQLGPTLFIPELLEQGASRLEPLRAEARRELSARHRLDPSEKWILHAGMLTPGKGLNFLDRLEPVVREGRARLVLMGGFGPKERDREFARAALARLGARFAERFLFVDSPGDAEYAKFLLSADLVVLPYDAGLSERRSSFLAALSCGANVWTTTGAYSSPLAIGTSGVHHVSAESWAAAEPRARDSVLGALVEPEGAALERRLKNLEWAAGRSWARRAADVRAFIAELA